MKSDATALHATRATATGANSEIIMNTSQWLIILGFPPALAAAKAMPELFLAEDAGREISERDARPGHACVS